MRVEQQGKCRTAVTVAVLAVGLALPVAAFAQTTLRIGMTAADIPHFISWLIGFRNRFTASPCMTG
jgi:hypothetical protein